ncbi:methylenetetrahydrofolate--tRNA-(uracil(54)-C(5))-methyltransferase (FADH(2)-oxidizing) TrmFO [Solidesulfovibrio carbinolicus]|uniref:Methylenetetrahydrofolate--tRNA-(uracil-5-)-methyltransferase TrmFO n=1 Tax=Solidesulfovibrio carbinolicus TaxID=296842 RepID=A0A4P6HJ63_9BACT|nr:methylenetetrahydrofolate--tRNA-(uracil(54)-C(5))-methyltransferase (FADH(2)-oxidizing) TrmFO [Solidesulfovibrio carbinolicus]QAZ65830.1 methylenetetrahydrofolate--tRNA-(uracil(54)-C(5))-methyltransferase (FADH(2)-oxidizing) TrmFO [Solidesulfovibrio carbinolicus]
MAIGIIGGGLAGCECALALARAGVASTIFECKPALYSPAHLIPGLAELVCSNSLRSDEPVTAVGLLKVEMAELGSAVIAAARETAVPAGKALAVDRDRFSENMTARIEAEPLVTLVRREIMGLSDPALAGFEAIVVAAGPLASDRMAASLLETIGGEGLYFYDAIAPIVTTESVDMDKAFWASRWQDGEGDYLNCPMDKDEYLAFWNALLTARKVPSREFEKEIHFEGCLPIEAMAERGERTLTFGPMKPVGLTDPRTGRWPYAVVQLRPENVARSTMNLVGFQTKLVYGEQERVFRMIPALHAAEFTRLGSIHRNTFVNAPKVLSERLELVARPGVYLAGQITGVEGYVESAACGLWLGTQLGARLARGEELPPPPVVTSLGALLGHLRTPAKKFQPSNVNFGLTPPLEEKMKKANRKMAYPERARKAWGEWTASRP